MGIEAPPYPAELLASAIALWEVQPQTQANLRRAVSTAYYAIFHLLIDEGCRNWARPEQRDRLSRMFEHRTMATASSRRAEEHKGAREGTPESRLRTVAATFRRLQEVRHIADYDLTPTMSPAQVRVWISEVERAFDTWQLIRDEQIAHDYLFSLLFREKDRT